jgi:hypothetical protein
MAHDIKERVGEMNYSGSSEETPKVGLVEECETKGSIVCYHHK